MDYVELENEIVNRYQKVRGVDKGDRIYLQSIRRKDIWENLGNLKDIDIKDVILNFLNKWRCRIKVTPDLISSLQQKLKELRGYFISVKDEKLESLDFDKDVTVDGRTFKAEDVIIKIFDSLRRIKVGRRNFGATATSKVLHMVNPNFFMMSDGNIREHYGCSANSNGYINFMWRMHRLCNEIIKSYCNKFAVNDRSAKEKIYKTCHNNWVIPEGYTTLPKLIDEFNYSRYTLNR